MNEVRFPIKTIKEGNKITKVCVEDCYRMINRIADAEDRSAEKWNEIWNSLGEDNTCLVTGRGVSQPNAQDAFDEEIGNNIAFIKAKLNANIKKRNILRKLWRVATITPNAIFDEIDKIDELIAFDLENMRKNYNPNYLPKLDSYGYEEEDI